MPILSGYRPRRPFSAALHIVGLALCTAVFAIPAAPALSTPCAGTTERTVFGKWKTVPTADSQLGAAKRKTSVVAPTNTRYLRVLVEVQTVGGENWALVLRDDKHHVLQTLGPADVAHKNELMTNRLATSSVWFELVSSDDKFPDLLLRQQIQMPETVEGVPYYSRKVEGVDDWKKLYEDPTLSAAQRKLGDNVAFLMVGLNEGSHPATCSGIALPPDLLITNWHCGPKFNDAGLELPEAFWGQSICDRTLVDLSWDDDKVSREFICKQVLATSRDLDYALLRIEAIDISSAISPVTISVKGTSISVSMVHHPAASKKMISTGCRVIDPTLPSWKQETPNASFSHDCDSESGSSGAPMFDTSGALVGLHHLGFETDATTGHCDKKNKAVWFGPIFEDLLKKLAAGDGKLTAMDVESIKILVQP